MLDEPSANLDAAATEHLMEILHTLKQQGYTIIISEHRIHYLKDIADRAVLIEYGQITRELMPLPSVPFPTRRLTEWG